MGKLLDALAAQGVTITQEVETAVMADFVEKSETDLLNTEIAGLKEQLEQRDADIENLKKTATGEETKQQLAELQSKYDTDTAELKQKLEDTKLDGILKVELLSAKARDAGLVSGLIDRNKLTIKDGKLEGLSDQLDAIKKDKAFLFEETGQEGTKINHSSQDFGYRYVPKGADGSEGSETVTLKDAVAEALQK